MEEKRSITISRLKQRKDFLRVADARRKWIAPALILQAAPCGAPLSASAKCLREALDAAAPEGDPQFPQRTEARIGFTVSKKVGNSVARNRARRRLRAAVDAIAPDWVVGGIDYVLIGRIETLDRPFPDLLRDVQFCLQRVLTVARSAPRPPRTTGKGRPSAHKKIPQTTAPTDTQSRNAQSRSKER